MHVFTCSTSYMLCFQWKTHNFDKKISQRYFLIKFGWRRFIHLNKCLHKLEYTLQEKEIIITCLWSWGIYFSVFESVYTVISGHQDIFHGLITFSHLLTFNRLLIRMIFICQRFSQLNLIWEYLHWLHGLGPRTANNGGFIWFLPPGAQSS